MASNGDGLKPNGKTIGDSGSFMERDEEDIEIGIQVIDENKEFTLVSLMLLLEFLSMEDIGTLHFCCRSLEVFSWAPILF